MCSSFLVSVDITEFQANEAYSILGLIQVTYNNNKHSIVEKEYIIVWTKPNTSIEMEYNQCVDKNVILNLKFW